MSRKEEINKDMRALVANVTGIDTKDENFRRCVEFADSNFRYHRFLSPDSHKIERAIDGLCEKFKVHSDLSKADDLKELTNKFLDQEGLEGREHGKTNTHYALLSLLVELSENPTSNPYQRTQPALKQEEEEDDFDWRGYLLDPQDLYFISHASSDSEEEELSDDEEDREKRVAWVDEIIQEGGEALGKLRLPGSDASDDNADLDSTLKEEGQRLLLHPSGHTMEGGGGGDGTDTARQSSNDFHFLESSLVVEYWKGKAREEDGRGDHSSSNLARDWNCYKQNLNEFHTPSATVFVTEFQVMREALWMLSGITDLYIFTYDDQNGQFGVNPDVYISHVTSESLTSFLGPLMDKAGRVTRLQTFFKSVLSDGENHRDSFTYQAFADCVWSFLTDFKIAVTDEERIIMAQEEMMSLDKMSYDLRPWLSKLDLMHDIYVRGVQATERVSGVNNAIRASLLLNTLYQVLHEVDPLDRVQPGSKSELVLNLLVRTSRPLLDITSNWITNGQLSDPRHEFVVQRNKRVKSLDETFWEKAFVSHVDLMPGMDDDEAGDEQQQQQQEQATTARRRRDRKWSRTAAGEEGRGAADGNKKTTKTKTKGDGKSQKEDGAGDWLLPSYVPIFLQNCLQDTLVTGKSMEVLESLGMLGEVLPGQGGSYIRPPSLYELLLQDTRQAFPLQVDADADNKDTSGAGKGEEDEEQSQLYTKDPVIHSMLNVSSSRDTLLNIYFASVFPNTPLPSSSSSSSSSTSRRQKKQGPSLRQDQKHELKVCAMMGSDVLRHCENSLHGYVRSRYKVVCPRLVEILKTEYKLVDCIHAMQRYYLMSEGDIMTEFCHPIFDKMDCREPWQDPYILDMYLHEAVGRRYPEDTERLRVEIAPVTNTSGPINATDCIRLKYQVAWPVDVVISGKCEDRYNSIFSFLLQIKRAKTSLEQLRFEDLSCRGQPTPAAPAITTPLGVPTPPDDEMDSPARVHRLHLLRFRLLYFVNSLDNYIMTRILHSSGLEFSQRLSSATDLDQIISTHSAYLDTIHERCLLHHQLSPLRDAIVQVLNLSLVCSTQWHQGLAFIKGSVIREMELKLTRCVNFLSSFLTNVIKRGSFPQLESLAVSLTSMQQK